MSTVVLAQSVRGSLAFGHAGNTNPNPFPVNAGTARSFLIEMTSSDWVDPAKVGTLTMDVALERSVDSGVTWAGAGGFGGATNTPGKGGIVPQPSLSVSWDGQAMLLRGTVTVGPSPFSWGVTVT